jgi:hypothetical protein
MTQVRHRPPVVGDERALIDQWRGIIDEALIYLRVEQAPDSVMCSWLEAFGGNLARKERDVLFTEFLKVEESVKNYMDGARPVEQDLVVQLREFGEKLQESGLN